ncbi:unnamed protein product [Pylaiella littoralis]
MLSGGSCAVLCLLVLNLAASWYTLYEQQAVILSSSSSLTMMMVVLTVVVATALGLSVGWLSASLKGEQTAHEAARAELAEKINQENNANKAINSLKNQHKIMKTRVAREKSESHKKKNQHKIMEARAAREKSEFHKKLEVRTEEVRQLEEEIATLKTANDTLDRRLVSKDELVDTVEMCLNHVAAKLEVARGEIDAKGVEITGLNRRLELCADERKASLIQLEEAQAATDGGKEDLELKTKLKEALALVEMHERIGTRMRATIMRLDGELASLQRLPTMDLRLPASSALPHVRGNTASISNSGASNVTRSHDSSAGTLSVTLSGSGTVNTCSRDPSSSPSNSVSIDNSGDMSDSDSISSMSDSVGEVVSDSGSVQQPMVTVPPLIPSPLALAVAIAQGHLLSRPPYTARPPTTGRRNGSGVEEETKGAR